MSCPYSLKDRLSDHCPVRTQAPLIQPELAQRPVSKPQKSTQLNFEFLSLSPLGLGRTEVLFRSPIGNGIHRFQKTVLTQINAIMWLSA